MKVTDQYLEILHKYWGYPDFRGIQKEIIESIANGEDTLGLMPTGGGKSITFHEGCVYRSNSTHCLDEGPSTAPS